MGIKEIIEAKRLARLAAEGQAAEPSASTVPVVTQEVVQKLAAETKLAEAPKATAPALTVAEPAPTTIKVPKTFAEILAERKAAAGKAQPVAASSASSTGTQAMVPASTAVAPANIAPSVALKPSLASLGVNLGNDGFEEAMLGKASVIAAATTAITASIPVSNDITTPSGQNVTTTASASETGASASMKALGALTGKLAAAMAAEEAKHQTLLEEADPADRTAYSDILDHLNTLAEASGEDLVQGMSILKKALHQNANACLLMRDQDVGQMVIALRRMTATELVDAKADATEKKEKKASGTKSKMLTADELQQAFEEL